MAKSAGGASRAAKSGRGPSACACLAARRSAGRLGARREAAAARLPRSFAMASLAVPSAAEAPPASLARELNGLLDADRSLRRRSLDALAARCAAQAVALRRLLALQRRR